ncbi:MAG: TIGR00282 family metallophosphoesterase [Pirellulales bacterium]|nr:TIGR00282 family metallophosphoesterase [Pirellulales bacterium]
MRILLIGDVVGKPGRKIVVRSLGVIRRRYNLDLIVVNGENAAAGSGITPDIYRELCDGGADGITLGDHIYRRRGISAVLKRESNIVKPANLPADAPGKGWMMLTTKDGRRAAVVSLLGRVFMKPVDCPFAAADRVLAEIPRDIKVVLVDYHAEATSDMQLMGRFLDSRVSAVLGTHTHVATADESILPGGTAFQCDVGMTGPYESIIGRMIDPVLANARTYVPQPFDVATEDVRLAGTIVDVDSSTGKATKIRRLALTEQEVDDILASGKYSD